MRALAYTAALGLALAATGASAQGQGETANSVGCGVGTILFDGQRGVAPQVLAATTNGSFGNQTFGVSSGTLGCTRDGVVRPPTEVRMLSVSSLDDLAREMARGEGETLNSLAALMGIEEEDRPAFFAATRANFDRLFPSPDTTADAMLVALNDVLTGDAVLRRYAFT
ncbi:MAG TPA: DUF3015 domain-containing protein [Geminicoccaceae bacterium]|nr:DUF3015 domain-containing protein [Geminicoccaceae bacterium]